MSRYLFTSYSSAFPHLLSAFLVILAHVAGSAIAQQRYSTTTVSFQDGASPTTSYNGTRDTFLRNSDPNSNFGTENRLRLDGNPNLGVLIKWDLSSVPANSVVVSATITFRATNSTDDAYEIYEMKRDWVESEATWNVYSTGNSWQTAGARGTSDRGSVALGEVSFFRLGLSTFRLNSTGIELIQEWIDDPSTNHGFAIQDYANATTDGTIFHSRDVTTATTRPKLTLIYSDSPPPPPPPRTPRAVEVSFQDGLLPLASYSGTRDTYIEASTPTENKSSETRHYLDSDPRLAVLLKWDLSSVPAGSIVHAAEIAYRATTNTSTDDFEIYEMKRDWVESEATWNVYSTGNSWQTAGASGASDRGSLALGAVSPASVGLHTHRLNSLGIALIQEWIDGLSNNYGFVIQDYTNADDQAILHSSRVTTANTRPKLTLVYSPPPARKHYAEVRGLGQAPCQDRNNPCDLQTALASSTREIDTVFVRLKQDGGTAVFDDVVDLMLLGEGETRTISVYVRSSNGRVSGNIVIKGDVFIDKGATLNLGRVRLRLHSSNIIMGKDSRISDVYIEGASGEQRIFMTDELSPDPCDEIVNAAFTNLTIDKESGKVTVGDCSENHVGRLQIGYGLYVRKGILDMGANSLWHLASYEDVSAADNKAPELVVSGGGRIEGSDKVRLHISNFPHRYSSGVDGCFWVRGSGVIDMDFILEPNEHSGACYGLDSIGGGGTSEVFNGATLYVFADRLNGNLLNLADARTEFWDDITVSDNIYIVNHGTPDRDADTSNDQQCAQGGASGNQSGVYLYAPAVIEGDVYLVDTDDPETTGCAEGMWFMGDNDFAEDATSISSRGTKTSTIKGDLLSRGPSGRSGIYVGSHNFHHNVKLEGHLLIGTHPVTIALASAAQRASPYVCLPPVRHLAGRGNKIVFSGSRTQRINLHATTPPAISALSIDKSGGIVQFDEGSGALQVDYVEVLNGGLVTGSAQGALLEFREGGYYVLNQNKAEDGLLPAPGRPLFKELAGPTSFVYAGSESRDIGSEISTSDVSVMTVAVADTARINLKKRISVRVLNLLSGSLVVHDVSGEDSTLTITETINVGNSGNFAYPADVTKAGQIGRRETSISFIGNERRNADMFLPAAADLESALEKNHERNVTIQSNCTSGSLTVTLAEGYTPIAGDLTISRIRAGAINYAAGALDLAGNNLVLLDPVERDAFGNATAQNYQEVSIGRGAFLCDSVRDVPCTATSEKSRLDEDPDKFGAALSSVPLVSSPFSTVVEHKMHGHQNPEDVEQTARAAATNGILVAGEPKGRTTLIARGSSAPVWLPSLRVDRAEGRLTLGGAVVFIPALENSSGTVELASSLIQLHVVGDFRLDGRGATFNMNSLAGGLGFERQLIFVYGDYVQIAGSTNVNGQEINVFGNHIQAVLDSLGQPGAAYATFNLGAGVHNVSGDVIVGPDTAGATGVTSRYALGGGTLNVRGNLHFAGSGDTDNGLAGTIRFGGTETQSVYQGSGARSAFGSVEIHNSGGGVGLLSDVTQNASGTLTLTRGFILSGSGNHSWAVMNEQHETDLVGRITAESGEGDRASVWKGSRRSFVAGRTMRPVTRGNAGGGLVTGGYLFPTGSFNSASDTTEFKGEFRPIILQMPDDLGTMSTATASTYQLDDMSMMAWPDEDLVVEAAGSQFLTLDNFANMFWKVEFDEIPGHDPNLRIVADGLPNVFDISRLRIVQWDCDGTNPRMAGVYDLSDDPVDDESFALNDMLNGLPNITQEGVNVAACNLFGIASNFLENPISIDQIRRGLARVQFINNVIGLPMDVYVDDVLVRNNFSPHQATGFNILAAGERKLRILPVNAPASSLALLEATLRLTNTRNYTVIAHGDDTRFDLVVKDRARLNARRAGNVEFFLVHGARNLGEVDVRILDATDNVTVLDHLANNIDFNDVGAYISMAPGAYNFEITTANNDRQIDVFRLEFGDLENATLTLNLSGIGKSSAEDLTVFGVDSRGDTFFPEVVTSSDSESELVSKFVLLGNYPNPFNPSTRIQFDLPETADITVQVVDMLGRSVMTLPAQSVEAGVSRSIELDASNLASGTYVYRVTAGLIAGPAVKTGRMVLLK